jgi:hypothetical protein
MPPVTPPPVGSTTPPAKRDILQPVPGLTTAEALLAVCLLGISGLGVIAQAYGVIALSYTAPFIVFPIGCLLGIAILLKRRLPERLHAYTDALIRGAVWGLLATFAYDAIRPVVVSVFDFNYKPFKAIHIFGELITGRPPGDTLSDVAGWSYHFWNGISFGMMFALLRPRGGVIAGVIWGETLQMLLTVVYVDLLTDFHPLATGTLVTGIIGHGLWGVVLGAGLKYRRTVTA